MPDRARWRRWRREVTHVHMRADAPGRASRRGWLLAAALIVLLTLLAACGEDDVDAKPTFPSDPPALWNPCDGLDTAFVNEAFGVKASKQAGSPQKPDCRFVPAKGSNGPAVSANYQMFGGSLEEFFADMGASDDADVRTPKVPGADGARIVVSAEKEQLYVTGFVQNGFLYEVVNVVDPAPYDVKRTVRAVRDTLERLTVHADDEGAGQKTG